MPTVDVYNIDRKKSGSIDLDDAIFGAPVKEHLLYAAVRYQMAKRRAGTHAVKERHQVSGGGRKPYKQKGTGRARQGTIRAPQFRGGGVVHGPKVRSHAHKLNRKVRAAALKSALSRRVEEGKILVLDSFELPEIKTKQVSEFLNRFELKDALVVLDDANANVQKSARNIKSVTVLPAQGLNVYDVLLRSNLVVTKAAVDAIVNRLGGGE